MPCQDNTLTLPQGATFEVLAHIPEDYADGFFAAYTVQSQLRTPRGQLVSDLNADWVDPGLTRVLRLKVNDTTAWPLGTAVFDICFTAPDGRRIFTSQEAVVITKGVTQP